MVDDLGSGADSVEQELESGVTPDFSAVITGLFEVIKQRQRDLPEGSYTTQLLSGHEDKLLKKIGEEATEVVMAAKDADVDHLRYEVGDLVYHLLVVMARWGVTLEDLAAELDERRR